MPEEKDRVRSEDEESDGTASDDSSEKDGDSDEQLNDENSIVSSESKHKEVEEKKKKKKAKKEKTKKKDKKKKEKKDKKEKEKDKKKKKLPPVQAPDYVHVQEPRHSATSTHSRLSMVSAITIPKPLQKLAKTHTGPPPKDLEYPAMTDLERDVSNITLPKTLTIGDQIDDSQRSARVSLLGDDSTRSSTWRVDPNTSLLDG